MPGLPVPHHLPEFAQVQVRCIGDAIQPSHPPLPPSPALTFPSIRVFSTELALHIRWPKCWSFSFSISPSNEYSGLISFRLDCFDLPVQGTLKSLLQHHSLKASVPQCSVFFTVQLSHLCMELPGIMLKCIISNSALHLQNQYLQVRPLQGDSHVH